MSKNYFNYTKNSPNFYLFQLCQFLNFSTFGSLNSHVVFKIPISIFINISKFYFRLFEIPPILLNFLQNFPSFFPFYSLRFLGFSIKNQLSHDMLILTANFDFDLDFSKMPFNSIIITLTPFTPLDMFSFLKSKINLISFISPY